MRTSLSFVFLILLSFTRSEIFVRKRRFLDSLWPSEVKNDVQTGLIYSQLPPEYLHLMSGINDHSIQRRDGASVLSTDQLPLTNPPVRFVHPTRMAQLKPFHQTVQRQTSTPPPVSPKGPKIVMKPNLSPSFTLKTKEQPLPDIHRSRFLIPKPTGPPSQHKSPFSTIQQLPIKKSYDNENHLSIKTAPIEKFYETREFQDLMNEFSLKLEIDKLPPIADVMNVLGTTTAEDTLDTIHDVMSSPEGLEMIRDFIDTNAEKNNGDDFYNYDEDVGVGEIKMTSPIRSFQPNIVPVHQYPIPVFRYRQPSVVTPSNVQPEEPRTWWKPSTWFNSAQKSDSEQSNIEVLNRIVPLSHQNLPENISYVRHFIAAPNQEIPIDPPFQTGARQILNRPITNYQNAAQLAGAKIMPTVQMSEDQFREMVDTLKLTPIRTPLGRVHQQVIPVIPTKVMTNPPTTSTTSTTTEIPTTISSTTPSTTTSTTTTTLAPVTIAAIKKKSFLPLPSFSNPIENRRSFSFIPAGPQRVSPYDFTAAGKFHKVNPEEMLKQEEMLISNISEMTADSFKSQ